MGGKGVSKEATGKKQHKMSRKKIQNQSFVGFKI